MNFRAQVISWNITRRCNLRCEHCYIHAGPLARRRDELATEECLGIIDQIKAHSPGSLIILTGGEPLLRKDVFQIARYASEAGFMVVVGTNGIPIRRRTARRLVDSGVRGVGISIDSLDPRLHDRFRGWQGAWENSVRGMEDLQAVGLPFLIQTTVTRENYQEVEAIAEFAHQRGAKVFNLYFLVPTGRGAFLSNISPEEYEALMHRLLRLQPRFAGQMLVNAKCAPHFQRVLWEADPGSPWLKTYVGAGGCPAGTQYMGIAPNGDMTPCPYLPVYGGNLRERSFAQIWEGSEVFQRIRQRKQLGSRCGACEFNQMCGGCRARAYGASGDYMEEDPWCVYQPGQHGGQTILPPAAEKYGLEVDYRLEWSPEARERAERIPTFARGMVIREIERYARERGYARITPEIMARARQELIGGRVGMVPGFLTRGGESR